MNRKIGLISSVVMHCSVAIFLTCLVIALFVQNAFAENLSYDVCAALSMAGLRRLALTPAMRRQESPLPHAEFIPQSSASRIAIN